MVEVNMHLVISDHAIERLKERTKTRPHKYLTLARKALTSKITAAQHKKLNEQLYKQNYRKSANTFVKSFNGNIYIFMIRQSKNGDFIAFLVTVY